MRITIQLTRPPRTQQLRAATHSYKRDRQMAPAKAKFPELPLTVVVEVAHADGDAAASYDVDMPSDRDGSDDDHDARSNGTSMRSDGASVHGDDNSAARENVCVPDVDSAHNDSTHNGHAGGNARDDTHDGSVSSDPARCKGCPVCLRRRIAYIAGRPERAFLDMDPSQLVHVVQQDSKQPWFGFDDTTGRGAVGAAYSFMCTTFPGGFAEEKELAYDVLYVLVRTLLLLTN